MKTNISVNPPQITKKEAPSLPDNDKIISILSQQHALQHKKDLNPEKKPEENNTTQTPQPNQEKPNIIQMPNTNQNNISELKPENNKNMETVSIASTTGLESQMTLEEENVQKKPKPLPQIKNNLSGIPDKDYIIKKIKEKKDDLFGLDYNAFQLSTVEEDRNSGYRALSLQIFGNEKNHNEIRKAIFTCCLNNRDKLSKYKFQKHRTVLNGEDYLRIIKTNEELLGDFELKAFSFLFNAEVFVFELKDDKRLYLISEHKLDEIDKSKIVLNICIIGESHWQVLYEKGRVKNVFCDKNSLVKTIEHNIKRQKHFELQFDYAKDNRKMKYIDLVNFLASNFIQTGGVFPNFINDITDERKKSYKKREFLSLAKKYFLDDKTGRLKIVFNVSRRVKNKNYKEFYIPYLLEKFNIIREVHDELTHDERNQKTLDGLVKSHDFWWFGIYQDIKLYGGHCPICLNAEE